MVGLDFYKEVVALAKKHTMWVLSDLAYADTYFDDANKPPSILQIEGAKDLAIEFQSLSKTYAMPGWRMGFAAGNKTLIAALARIKSYLDYGAYTPIQVAATAALEWPAGLRRRNPRHLQIAPRRARRCDGRAPDGTSRRRPRRCLPGRPIPEAFKELGSMEFAKRLLIEAKIAVSPGIGFGEYGEGHVRIALVENEQRIRQAARNVRRFLGDIGTQLQSSGSSRSERGRFAVGLAGLGNVGAGVAKVLRGDTKALDVARRARHRDHRRLGARIASADRGVDLGGVALRSRSDGAGRKRRCRRRRRTDGRRRGRRARSSSKPPSRPKKHVVTANKALLAHHGARLAALAEGNGVSLKFEAAICGGIPIVKALRESLIAYEISARARHPQRHLQFHPDPDGGDGASVRRGARRKRSGWAMPRPIPTLDIGGGDTAHKLTLLAALAFGTVPGSRRRRDDGHREGQPRRHRLCRRVRLPGEAPGRRAQDAERHRAARASGDGQGAHAARRRGIELQCGRGRCRRGRPVLLRGPWCGLRARRPRR